MRAQTLSATLAALLLFGLTGCGDDTLASPAPDETAAAVETPSEEPSDPDLPSNEDLELFVEAIASEKVVTLEGAQSLVIEESPAAGYLKYFTHNVNATIDAGLYTSEASNNVKEIDNGFEICHTEGQEKVCTAYTEFQGEDGLIVDFQIEGRAASERLSMGTGELVEGVGGSTAEFIAAYMNAADTHLIIAYDLHSGASGLEAPSMSYRSEDGRQSQSEDHYGAWNLNPDSKSHYVATFPEASLGGDALLDLWLSETFEQGTVVLPVKGE